MVGAGADAGAMLRDGCDDQNQKWRPKERAASVGNEWVYGAVKAWLSRNFLCLRLHLPRPVIPALRNLSIGSPLCSLITQAPLRQREP